MTTADRALALAFACSLVLGGGCSAPWTFTRREPAPACSAPVRAAPSTPRTFRLPSAVPDRPHSDSPSAAGSACFQPCGGSELRQSAPGDLLALFDADLPAVSASRLTAADWESHDRGPLMDVACRVLDDHRHYYSAQNFWEMGYALAGASVLANTSLDEDFQGWYQREVRSSGTDDFADFCKTFGEGDIFIPSFACAALAASILPEGPLVSTTGEFAGRTTRAYLVGAPPMLFMQGLLGGSRPGEDPVGSGWKAFDDNNAVSGHAFMGAVPFITAAQMSDRPLARAALYACSTLTAWSRVNDDAHYLSQACLGWWMAYMACRAVDGTQTARQTRTCEIVPVATPEMAGVGVTVWR